MNTAKIYQDSEGNDCSIWQVVRREPDWAANRIQVGEKAIERVAELEQAIELLLEASSQFLTKDEDFLAKSYFAAEKILERE